MSVPKRLLLIFVMLGLGNPLFLFSRLSLTLPVGIFIALVLGGLLLWCCIRPGLNNPSLPKKLRQLEEGCAIYETTLLIAILLILEHAALLAMPAMRPPNLLFAGNFFAGMGLLILPLTASLIRLLYAAEQFDALLRYLILATWWLPLIGVFLNLPTYRAAKQELSFVRTQYQRDLQRHHEQICRTKFPLLLLHSNFYPDWKPTTCWGRIPDALEKNGALIFYGNRPTSSSVSQRAEELCTFVQNLRETSGAEKINIVAHSSRGLDARYSISALGLHHQVASLTTICTPHRGCLFAQGALDHLPQPLSESLSSQRDRLLSQLEDQYPDFYGTVSELTAEACADLNQRLPNAPGVYYQSVGAKMAHESSAPFPLNMSYRIVHGVEGDNDGLVATSSMPWGEHYIEATPPGAVGISHGDMIDLTRRNIPGFDICEFYVALVQGLKDKGF